MLNVGKYIPVPWILWKKNISNSVLEVRLGVGFLNLKATS